MSKCQSGISEYMEGKVGKCGYNLWARADSNMKYYTVPSSVNTGRCLRVASIDYKIFINTRTVNYAIKKKS